MATVLLPAGSDGLRPFTRESLSGIEHRIAEEQAKNAKDSPESCTKAEHPKAQADLEAGKVLPRLFGEIPAELVGVPLEDIDPFYFNNHKVSFDRAISEISLTVFRFMFLMKLVPNLVFVSFHW